jgi:hypothetical protein
MNGSLFAMLLYMVLYLQDDLGYSALGTGVRLLVLSGATMVTATISGRLSSVVPARWLIGPGLVIVGVGLLVMSGIHGMTSWTHLIPGFVLAGAGSGMVNPPLASTAVGVVDPRRSGMASGVNTTFRQIGIATGIAAYGTIFASSLQSKLGSALAPFPALHGNLAEIVKGIKQGDGTGAISSVPPSLRLHLIAAVRSSFAGALDLLLVVSAIVAIVGALSALVLIRPRDFVTSDQESGH